MNRSFGLIGIAALALGVSLGDGSYRPREFTLEEEEAQSARRMLNRARARARQTIRERERELQRLAAEEAARIEEARPKSRQELRARARDLPSSWDARQMTKSRPQSDSLKRLIRKKRRGKSF